MRGRILLLGGLLAAASSSVAGCARPLCDGVEARLSVSTAGSGTDRVVAQVSAAERPRPKLALLKSQRNSAVGVLCIEPGSRRVVSARAYDRGGRITHTGQRILDVSTSFAFDVELLPRSSDTPLVLHAESPELTRASVRR